MPTDVLQLLLFYHDQTKNTPTAGARALKRDWTQQPRCWRRYYGAVSTPLPIPTSSQVELIFRL